MIDQSKEAIEAHYCINGPGKHHCDTEVIYGDTDSVMIKFGVEDMAENIRLGKMILFFMTGIWKLEQKKA